MEIIGFIESVTVLFALNNFSILQLPIVEVAVWESHDLGVASIGYVKGLEGVLRGFKRIEKV